MVLNLEIFGLGKKKEDPRIRGVYDLCVAHARTPTFYLDYKVPDTMSGRFDLIVLHTFLFFHRIKAEDDAMKDFGQKVFDTFVEDMDYSLRELGVGYQKVPKRMKQMGEAFYGRVDVYDKALENQDRQAMRQALGNNVYAEFDDVPDVAERLVEYIFESSDRLTQIPRAALIEAEFQFPDPADFLK